MTRKHHLSQSPLGDDVQELKRAIFHSANKGGQVHDLLTSAQITLRTGARRLSPDRIITRILQSALVPKFRFQIQEETVVSRATLSKYIENMLHEGLLEEVDIEGKTLLQTTDRGLAVLRIKKADSLSPKERVIYDEARSSGSAYTREEGATSTE